MSGDLTRRRLFRRAAGVAAGLGLAPGLLRVAATEAVTRVRNVRTAVPILHPLPRGVVRFWEHNWHEGRTGPPAAFDHRSSRSVRAHNGNDLFCAAGTPIYAVVSGRVRRGSLRRPRGLYGKTVGIEDVSGPATEGNLFLYAHLQSVRVREGQLVRQGEVIGTVGATGNAAREGPQLHFEVRLGRFTCPVCNPDKLFKPSAHGNGMAVDPAPTLGRAKRLRRGQKVKTRPTLLTLLGGPGNRPGEFRAEVSGPRALAGKYVRLEHFQGGRWHHRARLVLDGRGRASKAVGPGTYRATFPGYNAFRPGTSAKLELTAEPTAA